MLAIAQTVGKNASLNEGMFARVQTKGEYVDMYGDEFDELDTVLIHASTFDRFPVDVDDKPG